MGSVIVDREKIGQKEDEAAWTTSELFDVLESSNEFVEGFVSRDQSGMTKPPFHVNIVKGHRRYGTMTRCKVDQGIKWRMPAECDAFKRRNMELGEKGIPINFSVLDSTKYQVGDIIGIERTYRPSYERRRKEENGIDLEDA